MVELWERAANVLTTERSGDERWCYPCWIQSEPAQGSSSPQGNYSTQRKLFFPKNKQEIAKLGIYF